MFETLDAIPFVKFSQREPGDRFFFAFVDLLFNASSLQIAGCPLCPISPCGLWIGSTLSRLQFGSGFFHPNAFR
ncbi:hypothetical protein NKH49_05115 [Mesorhizobium sp. M1088]|uniref:hypothetical protein n=1 Tax=Mesorhizobium sp. M1088 TaxID=2957056 RepID=UPI00333622A9